jgi:hypothetical protein
MGLLFGGLGVGQTSPCGISIVSKTRQQGGHGLKIKMKKKKEKKNENY